MNNFKYKLSQFYLDISGRLPKFLGQWVGHLQHIKSHQDKDAVDCLEKNQRPTDNDLKLEGIITYEIYHLENFSELEKNLDSIYSKQKHSVFGLDNIKNRYKKFINNTSKNIASRGGSWVNLGYLIPNKSTGFISSVCIKELPKEIKYIHLTLYQLLPSVIAVCFHTTLTEKINEDIDILLKQKCVNKIVFTSILPWKSGWSSTSASSEKEKKMYSYIENLKLTVAAFLQTYFKGYYLSEDEKDSNLLCPNIEIFSINKILSTDNTKNSQNWFWNSLGFQWYYQDIVYKSKTSYFFNHTGFFNKKYQYKLLVERNSLNIKDSRNIENVVSHTVSNFLMEYTSFIVLKELFLNIFASLGKLRHSISKQITAKKTSFEELLKYNTVLNKDVYILNRINSEWQALRKIRRKRWKKDRGDFKQISDPINPKNILFELSISLWKSLDYYSELVVKEYNEMRNNYENYLSAHNLINADKTQRRISRLTHVLVAGMVIQIVSSSESLKAYLLLIFYWLMKILKLGNFSH